MASISPRVSPHVSWVPEVPAAGGCWPGREDPGVGGVRLGGIGLWGAGPQGINGVPDYGASMGHQAMETSGVSDH